jgi:hypothetical protein
VRQYKVWDEEIRDRNNTGDEKSIGNKDCKKLFPFEIFEINITGRNKQQ